MGWHRQNRILFVFILLLILITIAFPVKSLSQDNSSIEKKDTVDVGDIWRSIFKKKTSAGKKTKEG